MGEACDDGNLVDGDGCQANCALPTCGDGILDAFEVCDDTNIVSGDGCNATCTSDETCGNSILDVAAGEACDDGNLVDGDGCDSSCQLDCIPPLFDCFGVCVDRSYDPNNCGFCGTTCTGGDACVAGICEPLLVNTNVLILGDGDADPTVDAILTGAGYDVTISAVIEFNYDGTNPPPSTYCAVVHLNGDTWPTGMTVAGQQALQAYVNAGGGFVGMEWNACEESDCGPTMVDMPELILLVRNGGGGGPMTYDLTAAGLTHPVTQGLPASFTFSAGYSPGTAKGGMGISVLATSAGIDDAILVRDYGTGRVVNYSHAGNYSTYTPFTDPNVAQLLVQSVDWLCGP
jgi:cysteine-rich repeat protein